MSGFELLGRARAAGLRVVYDGAKLRIRGPRSAEVVALELLDHKEVVVRALLAGGLPYRVGARVETPAGPGQCWQVFASRVGVVLDASPERVAFFRPVDVRPGADEPTAGAPLPHGSGRHGAQERT